MDLDAVDGDLPAGLVAGGGGLLKVRGPDLEAHAGEGMVEEGGHTVIIIGIGVAGKAAHLIGVHHVHSAVGVHVPCRVVDSGLCNHGLGGRAAVRREGGIADEIEGSGLGPVVGGTGRYPAVACTFVGHFLIHHESGVVGRVVTLEPGEGAEGHSGVTVLVVGVCPGHGAMAGNLENNLLAGTAYLGHGAGGECCKGRGCDKDSGLHCY